MVSVFASDKYISFSIVLMDRISNEEIAAMWARHYPRRNDLFFYSLLSSLIIIVKVRAFGDGTDEFQQIERMK